MSKETFEVLRKDWMGESESAEINYCAPIYIGVLESENSRLPTSVDGKKRLDKTIEKISKKLKKCFGKFDSAPVGKGNQTANQLVLLCENPDGAYVKYLGEKLGAAKIIGPDEINNGEMSVVEIIRKYCWMVIAAWDGNANQANSDGVYNSIKRVLSNDDNTDSNRQVSAAQENYKITFPENRPIYQIVLPLGDENPKINYTLREIYPHPLETIEHDDRAWFDRERFAETTKFGSASRKNMKARRKIFERNASKIKRFNGKVCNFSKKIDKRKKDIYDLLPWHHYKDYAKGIAKKPLPKRVEKTNLRQIFYDVMSMTRQHDQNIQNIALIVCVALGLLCFSLYTDLEIEIWWFLLAYVILIFAAYGIYWFFVKRTAAHSDYLEFRTIAEGMRVQCYWYAANINKSVGAHYKVKFQKDMSWAKLAFNSLYLTDYLLDDEDTSQYVPQYDVIKTEWIGVLEKWNKVEKKIIYAPKFPDDFPDDKKLKKDLPTQYGFYQGKQEDFFKKNKAWTIRTAVATVLLVLVSIVLVCMLFTQMLSDRTACILIFLIGLFNTFPALVTAAVRVQAYGELTAKYSYCKQMAQQALQDYEDCDKLNNKSIKIKAIKAIFTQFGIEALEENAEWLMIKNDREPEVAG